MNQAKSPTQVEHSDLSPSPVHIKEHMPAVSVEDQEIINKTALQNMPGQEHGGL